MATNKKQTSPKVATKAAKLLTKSKSRDVKSVAASALSQTNKQKK